MSDYICRNCGATLDEREIKSAWGWLTDDPRDKEEYGVCPVCGSDELEEARTCIKCGEPFLPDDVASCINYCEDCRELIISEYRKDPLKCYEVTSPVDSDVSINAFLASMFSPSQIEVILLKELTGSKADCIDGINADLEWFLECVEISEKEKRGGNNE